MRKLNCTIPLLAIALAAGLPAQEGGAAPLPGTAPAPKSESVTVFGVTLDVPEGWVIDRSGKYGVPLVVKHPDFSVNGTNVTMIVIDAAEELSVDDLQEKIYALADKRGLTVLEDGKRQVGLFADGYYALRSNSPCTSLAMPECGQIGAYDVDCGESAAGEADWSKVKTRF